MEAAKMARPTHEQLEARVRELEAQNARLESRIAQLERLLKKPTRDGKRQAAPVSKGSPNAPDAERLRTHYEQLPDRLEREHINPPIPWLYGFKLDFRFQ